MTGAPAGSGSGATWQGTRYQRREANAARVTRVQGEFYWRVPRDERALVIDYAGGNLVLVDKLAPYKL